ncbi:MAG: RNA polymerase sigma factor [Acidobacteria bacterium]|nr:RNA polymerase sigma factor [Acidobacteriota bacterium]
MTDKVPGNITDWLQDLRRGDTHGLAGIIDQYGEELMRYLTSILGNPTAAEDAFQDTWLRVIKKIDTYDPRRNFEPWLFRIARNRAYDLLRSHRRWWRRPSVENRPIDRDPDFAESDAFFDSFWRKDLLRSLFAELEPRYREILWLRYYRDMSYPEIAAFCRLPLGTVKSRIRRALDQLGSAYCEQEESHEIV